MPWIPVNRNGLVPNVECPQDALTTARDHKLTPEVLQDKKKDETWTVTFGCPNAGGPRAAAWYRVLLVPDAASGQDTWKIGVSYWDVVGPVEDITYRRQWLWVFQRRWTCVMTAARDYFFVKRPEPDVPGRARVHVEDRTSVIEGDFIEVSVPEDPHQEPKEEPQAGVHREG